MTITLLSCILYILGSIQGIKVTTQDCDNPVCNNDAQLCPNTTICEPIDHSSITTLETCCAIVLSIDYFLRTSLSGTVPSRLASMSKAEMSPHETLELQVRILDEEDIYEDDVEYSWYVQLLYYILKPIHLVDLMAILPFLITSSGASVPKKSVGVLKIFRVFRLIKIVKSTVGLQIMIQTCARASEALQLLVFFSILGIIFFASLSFFLEEGVFTLDSVNGKGYYIRLDSTNHDERSPYESIPLSMYWAVVTMCTVGYGDLAPTSDGGRVVACICMYVGLLVFALPISVIGSNFEKLVDETKGATAELIAESVLELIHDQPDLIEGLLEVGIDKRLFNLSELKRNSERRTFFFNSSSSDLLDPEELAKRAALKERYRLEHLAKNQARKLNTLATIGRGLLSNNTCDLLNVYLSDIGIEKFVEALENPDTNFSELFIQTASRSSGEKANTQDTEESMLIHSCLMDSRRFQWNGANLLVDLNHLHDEVSNANDKEERFKRRKTYSSL